jgi:hypothetical protein
LTVAGAAARIIGNPNLAAGLFVLKMLAIRVGENLNAVSVGIPNALNATAVESRVVRNSP